MEPDSPPNLEIKHAPDFDQRKTQHQSLRDSARAKGRPETWPVRTGTYKNGITDITPEVLTVNGLELDGMETVIYKQIMEILAAKQRDSISDPVVVLDIGGMYGISLIKLAKATEELVKQGNVVYAVSNLTFNPGTMPDEEVRSTVTGLGHPEYDDFFLQNRGLVHFIMSDVEELKDIQLSIPNGRSLRLFGNLDLIHEQNALGKSPMLDSDLPDLGNALSPYGTLLLGDKEAKFTVNPDAFKTGEANLLQTGVKEVGMGDAAKYRVFAKTKAPALAA